MVTFWIPADIEFFASMDWGHAKPGCIGWWACLPEGRYHVIREWKFQWLADDDIASGYHARTKESGFKTVRYVAGDPSMWIRDGRNASRGQSRAETFLRARMPMRKAENAREDGWSRLRSMLRVPTDDTGRPTGESPNLTIDASCTYLRRTIPAQRSDKTNADDVDTSGDDHGGDMLRYGAMSRPHPTLRRFDVRPKAGTAGALLAELRDGLGRASVLGAQNVVGAR